MSYEGLRIGMFLGGLLMAMVPISISVGIAIWAFRQRESTAEPRSATKPAESDEAAT